MTASTDTNVGKLVFGTAAIGMAYGLARAGEPSTHMSDDEAMSLVRTALRAGLRVFDTAPAYGLAEDRLGRSLGGEGRVWTKVGRRDMVGPNLCDHMLASLRTSLERLRRTSLDLLQWHNWTSDLATDADFVRCWATLGSDRRVSALGASTYGVEDARTAIQSGLFQVVQVEWNLLNPSVVNAIGKEAQRCRVALAVRSVFLQGALTDDARVLPGFPSLRSAVASARACARSAGLSLQDLALSSALALDEVEHVLVGIDRASQIQSALRAASLPYPGERLCQQVRALSIGGDPAVDPRTWRAMERAT
jgi:aryl-alcohol dehydrogenase-like predicted oxidoreductase